ncbi:MAG: hypothetical protein UU80_C0006G0014 [candidate division WWE3 bacterium GW2011_GWA1_41_8]|uniref:Uncharacterized protein n=3 Tax=Katanobacteria TaxID=422282 RepID=A0A0G1AB14_UNCKA|nr:MAG: hypothetical protein UU80_C0006G0014 [candidate division WWE3 bacterium GW2011_GWA1_41_8]OGC56893.1 MAG: hypothetical protein A2976_00540 [candidate division WWE3 bacterium RIFCSPLOWO2_01_FULL_41_9]
MAQSSSVGLMVVKIYSTETDLKSGNNPITSISCHNLEELDLAYAQTDNGRFPHRIVDNNGFDLTIRIARAVFRRLSLVIFSVKVPLLKKQ